MNMLRSTSLLLLTIAGSACGFIPSDPFGAGGSSGTTDGAGTSTGPGASATSVTTGTPPGTSSSTAGDTTMTGGTSDDTGGTFIMIPDGCAAVGGHWYCTYECDVVIQDCPEGEKCVPWANDGGNLWNAVRCSPVPDEPAGLGQPCVAEGSPVSGLDDCDVGALCWGVDPRTLQGTCEPLCDEDAVDSCGDAAVCAGYDYFAPFVCLNRCDPLDPASCAADEACEDIEGDLLCIPTVALPQGLTCGAAEQYCTPDQACVGAGLLASCEDPECCTPWCDLSAPDPDLPCAAVPGETCLPFFEKAPAGYEHVGVCGL
jgi:hypothetical protein